MDDWTVYITDITYKTWHTLFYPKGTETKNVRKANKNISIHFQQMFYLSTTFQHDHEKLVSKKSNICSFM